MRVRSAICFGLLLGCGVFATLRLRPAGAPEGIYEVTNSIVQAAPSCPWRDPAADLKRLFPGESTMKAERRVLSGIRNELAQRLGRLPRPEENVLEVYRVWRGDDCVGDVTTRRVKGTFGAVEVVLGADPGGRITGLLFQRMREPESTRLLLESDSWRNRFQGRNTESLGQWADFLEGLPEASKPTAREVVEGVRSSLILLEVSKIGRGAVAQTHTH